MNNLVTIATNPSVIQVANKALNIGLIIGLITVAIFLVFLVFFIVAWFKNN